MDHQTLTLITVYASIALIIYYLIQEMFRPKQGLQKWVSWIIIALILGFIIWFAWAKHKQEEAEYEDEYEDEDEDNKYEDEDNKYEDDYRYEDEDRIRYSRFRNSEKGENSPVKFKHVQLPDDYEQQNREFAIIDSDPHERSQIQYKDFKKWCLSPEFLQRYTVAVKQALTIQKSKFLETRKQCVRDLRALRSKESANDALSKLLQRVDRSEDVKTLETTINEITHLLKKVQERMKNISLESSRKSLILAITHPKHGIDSLTGREDIKDFLALQLYTFSRNPRIFFSHFQNIAVYGPSGVGKTKLAQVIGHVYAASGILLKNEVGIITKQSLTTAYVNESGRITRRLLLSYLGAIVFIDEAYDLSPPPSMFGQGLDHGHEAIAEMVNFMDKMQGLSIIIVAGYENEMETRFMSANEGLPRRFPHKLILKSYEPNELTNILIRFIMGTCPDIKFTKKHGDFLYTIIKKINESNPEVFKHQAGDMLNLSGFISRSIYGTPGLEWPDDAEDILFCGINAYLAPNGISLEELA